MSRTFTIQGEAVLVSPSWSIADKINSRTTCSLTIVDLLDATGVDIGDELIILNDATKIFAGTVETIVEVESDPGFLEYQITAVDFSALADKRLIADSVVNTLAGDIVTNNILPILAEESVTAGTIEDGVTVNKAVFNYITCADALDKIKDISGLNWNIDFDKKLQFFSRDTNLSPYTLNNDIQHNSFSRNITRNQYRNKQYIRAGKGKTTTQTKEKPSPKPDGVSRNFIMRFPLAEKPTIYINTVAVNSTDVGVNGLDKNKKYYFSYDSNVITQADTETVLSTTDVIEVTYTGMFPIMVVADNADEIAERKLTEGNSGIYELLVKEDSINTSTQALEFAQGLLVKYGDIPSTLSFETEVSGLKAGQLLPVQKTLYGINDSFLIESINISARGNDIVYSVKCLDGSALGGWEEFFKTILKGNRQFVISENEVLVLLNVQSEKTTSGSELTIDIFDCLYPSDTLYPSTTLYPGTLNVEVKVND